MPRPTPEAVKPTAKPLRRDVAKAAIRDAILAGEFAPGEILNEHELETWLGVSNTPIRDALNDLARVGLVELVPKRFTRVAMARPGDREAARHTLGALLGGVTRLSVARMPDTHRDEAVLRADAAIAAMRLHDTPLVRQRLSDLFTIYLENVDNQILLRLCTDHIYALAYKIDTGSSATRSDYEYEESITAINNLKEATRTRNATAAGLATQQLLGMPT